MLPIPNLDDKTFAQLIEDAKKQIARYAPGWTDYNAHDPGITMLELFAWLAEGQRYYLDQVRDEHIRKYVKLLGTAPALPKPARAVVRLLPLASGASSGSPLVVPARTKLLLGEISFETEEEVTITDVSIAQLITLDGSAQIDQLESAGHDGITFHPFGETARAGNSLYIGLDRIVPQGTLLSIAFRMYDGYPVPITDPEMGETPFDATPPNRLSWSYLDNSGANHWTSIQPVVDQTLDLSRSGILTLRMPDDAAMRTHFPTVAEACCWIKCTVINDDYELSPRIDSVMLNTVSIVQHEAVEDRYVGRSIGLGNSQFELGDRGIVADGLSIEVREADGTWKVWDRVDDFDASAPGDEHYVLDSGSGQLRFGDGQHGKVPPASNVDSIRASYRKTLALQGSITSGTSGRFVGSSNELNGALRIEMLTAASGGAAAESVDEAMARAASELKQLTRAVTDADYEQLACRAPGLRVARAKALMLEENAVTVVAVPYSDQPNPQPSSSFIDTIARHLDRYRLLTTRVRVMAPQYVKVMASVLVRAFSGYDSSVVTQAVEEALNRYLHPLEGGPHGSGWPFGRTVYLSELYALVDGVTGVDNVRRLQLFLISGSGQLDEQGNLTIAANALVYADQHEIEIELPWSGRLTEEGAFYARFGS